MHALSGIASVFQQMTAHEMPFYRLRVTGPQCRVRSRPSIIAAV